MRLLLLFPIFPRSIPHIVHQTVPTKNHGTNADTLHEKLPQYSHPRLPSVPPQIMQMHSRRLPDSSHKTLPSIHPETRTAREVSGLARADRPRRVTGRAAGRAAVRR